MPWLPQGNKRLKFSKGFTLLMTQLKLEDFFREIDNDVLAKSYKKNELLRLEEEPTKNETSISFHSFKVRKSQDLDDSYGSGIFLGVNRDYVNA